MKIEISKDVLAKYIERTGKPILIIDGLPQGGEVFHVIDYKVQDRSQNRPINEFTVVDVTSKASLSTAVDAITYETFVSDSRKEVLHFKDHPNITWYILDVKNSLY